MTALEVFVNGHRVCLVGVGNDGVLGADVSWTGGPETEDFIHLFVGGLADGEHVNWTVPPIGVGSEVLIRVVEAQTVDPPSKRERFDGKTRLDEYWQQLGERAQDLTPEERRQLLPRLIAELQDLAAEPARAPDCGGGDAIT
jgi:hypothetical protein